MPQKRASHLESVESVESQRLQALAETQRKHIEELNTQLHELLEVQQQQQLQLVEQSPARRNVRQLLARAAADNTALAKRVEELRAQRNALAVTKAALTAQMSQLIRAAADDAQREVQHRHLLAQVQQLYQITGQHGASQPTAQLAAVLSYVERASPELQALQGQPGCSKTGASQPPQAADSCCTAALSPTGQHLDSKATSQLIWWDGSCTETSRAAAATLDDTPAAVEGGVSKYSGDASNRTARSHFSDLSHISPLRVSSTPGCTPTSNTQTTAQVQYGDGLGSPLSCQSMSQLSSSKCALGDELAPRCLDMEATPISKCRMLKLGDVCSSSKFETYSTPVAAVGSLDQSPSRDQCGSSSHSVHMDLPESPVLLMSPVFGLKPEDLKQQGRAIGYHDLSNSNAAVRRQNAKPSAGLQLGEEFKLAACESVWPSPALPDSGCNSSSTLSCAAWLARQQPDLPDASRVLTFSHALLDGEEESEEEQHCQHTSRRYKALVMGLLLVVPLTTVAFTGGAAWHFKQQGVLDMVAVLNKGLRATAQQTVVRAARGWRNLQQGLCATWAKVKRLSQLAQHFRAGWRSSSPAFITEASMSHDIERDP